VLAIVLGIIFKGQNVAYMVGLAFAIAASANFPALVLSMFWRKFTTRAAQVSPGTAVSVRPSLRGSFVSSPTSSAPWSEACSGWNCSPAR